MTHLKMYKIFILFLLISFLIIIILRETGLINFHYYHSEFKCNSNYDWDDNFDGNSATFTDTSSSYKLGDSLKKFKYEQVPLTIKYEGEVLYNEPHKSYEILPLEISINNISTGFLWMPLYKSASFKANIDCQNYISFRGVKHNVGSKTLFDRTTGISMRINIEGNILIKGICSHKEASDLVYEVIVEELVKVVKEHLKSLDLKNDK